MLKVGARAVDWKLLSDSVLRPTLIWSEFASSAALVAELVLKSRLRCVVVRETLQDTQGHHHQ